MLPTCDAIACFWILTAVLNKNRDIQPCNVFLDRSHNVLVGDWGHSKTWTPYETSQENCGSLCYAAPVSDLISSHLSNLSISLSALPRPEKEKEVEEGKGEERKGKRGSIQ